jgi:drug/metabolite transporter (DMT)-like permease
MEDTQKAQIALLISTFIWGITPIFIEIALDYFSPLYILTIRFGLGVLALSLFLPLIKKRNGLSLLTSKPCVVVGWLYAFGYLTATIGQKMTTPGLATLISTSYVIIVPFISKKLEKTELSPKIMIIAFIKSWNCISSISCFIVGI